MTCNKPVFLLCLMVLSSCAKAKSQRNEWSNCSRTCGMGISHRLIPCRDANCNGTKKEFRVCNLKECPDDYVGFRSEQCQKYGEGLIPFNDTSNPCKLMCMLPGQKPVEKATAIDGTSCLSSGICVDGTCVPVGCNGILGSGATTDECGRCGSTNGICLRVPCMINHNISTNEYITTVPVGSTRIKITKTPSCNISGLGGNLHLTNDAVFPAPVNSKINGKELTINGPLKEKITVKINCPEGDHMLTCGYYIPLYKIKYYGGDDLIEQEYQWIVGNGFTPCSQTCGTGIQRSRIYCQNKATNKTAEALHCDDLSTEHLNTRIRKCNLPPCPFEWQVSDWSPCSESCGGGRRSRNVTCVQATDELSDPVTVDPAQCLENKPRSQEKCNHHRCYNHWHKGSWSDCSSSCGNGRKTRKIICINAHGMEEETDNCNRLVKPKEEDKCIGEMCTYKWIASNWSNCSVHCGQGNQTRNVYCQYINESKAVNDSLCLQSNKPIAIQQCRGYHCTGEWRIEKWGPCEASECNMKGSKYRNYYCVVNESSEIYIDNTKCDNSTKPRAIKECYKTEGCKPEWVPLQWKECSKSCDRGYRVRGLQCKLGENKVNNTECPRVMPTVFEECNVGVPCPCVPSSDCKGITKIHCLRVLDVEALCKSNCCDCACTKS